MVQYLKRFDIKNLLLMIVLYGALLVSLGGLYDIGIWKILMGFLEIPVFVMIGFLLANQMCFKEKIYFFCLISLVWFAAAYCLRGELSLAVDVEFSYRCLLVVFAIPFAYYAEEVEGHKKLDLFLAIFCAVFSVLLWLCYIGIFRGENILIGNGLFEFGATYTYTGRIMLKLNYVYYYTVGYIAVGCFFVSLYLAAAHRTRHLMPIWVFFLGTFFAGVWLTYSRTGVIALTGGLLMCIYLLLRRLPMKKAVRNGIFVLTCCVGVIAVIVGMNYVYKAVHSIRDFWYGITTLSSRTTIWAAIPKAFADHPLALITGFPAGQRMEIINSYLPELDTISHMHNGFLEVLVRYGVPGLLLVLAFCAYLIKCCCKVFFASEDANVMFSDRLMVVVPAVCMAINLTESALLCDQVSFGILELIFALYSGYIIEKSKRISRIASATEQPCTK